MVMEFDNVCTMIQGNLRSVQKSLGIKFSDIDRDNDDEVQQIAQAIRNVSKEASFNEDSIRKLHLLLLLNTKWEHMAYFEEDNNFCHFLNVIPLMSRYLYFKLVSTLEWHEYLGEVILHFPEFLVRELLVALEADLKYIDSKCAVPFVYSLLRNLFHKIMYLQEHCRYRVTEFVKLFSSISKFDFEAIVNEMDCPVEKKHQYWGYVYRMLLDLVRFCIEKIQNWDIPSLEAYSHSCEYNYEVWPQAKQGSCRGKLCLGMVASKCLTVSENISIDVYMSWTEVDIIEDMVEKTLQMCVRESAFKTRQMISSVGDLHNSVAGLTALEKRLTEIELKPTTEEDEIAKADADTILMNLFNPKKTQAKWLRGLINIGIFESAPHMKVVSENASLVDEGTMTLLVDSAVRYLSNHSIEEQEHELIRSTIKSCLRAQSQSDQLSVLSRFVQTYGLMAPLMSPSFDQRTTLLFNKIVNDEESKDEIYSEIVWLAIENREDLFKRAFNECLSSKHKTSLILDLVRFISPAADVIIPHSNLRLSLNHILTIMRSVKNSNSEKLRGDFMNLISVTCEMNICSAETLLFDHIIPLLESAVSEMNTADVDFYLEVVCALAPLCKPRKVQYIALLIKVLNRFRPKISNFNAHSVDVTTKCIELLKLAMFEVHCNGPSNELGWLKSLAEKAPPLTAQYLGAVLHSSGQDKPKDQEQQVVIDGKSLFWSLKGLGYGKELVDLKPHERAELVTSTLKVLPSLTMREWERIGGGRLADFDQTLYTFAVLVDSLLVLLQVPAMMQNLACFGNMITNLIHYTTKNVLPKLKSKRGVAAIDDLKQKVLLLTSVLPEELEPTKRPQLQRLEQILDGLRKPKKALEPSDQIDSEVALDEETTP